jgi:hypothetical protein
MAHSKKEARITREYLEGRKDLTYLGMEERKGHFHHKMIFEGTTVTYSHGGQRDTKESIIIKDIISGIRKSLINTQRHDLGDLWVSRS